jgi:hypothetical protein
MNPILWLHYARPRSRWYDLPAPERERLLRDWRAIDAASIETGGKHLGDYRVRGQSDWSTVSVWKFPDVDAVVTHWQARVRAGYSTWFAFANSMGSKATAGHVTDADA